MTPEELMRLTEEFDKPAAIQTSSLDTSGDYSAEEWIKLAEAFYAEQELREASYDPIYRIAEKIREDEILEETTVGNSSRPRLMDPFKILY